MNNISKDLSSQNTEAKNPESKIPVSLEMIESQLDMSFYRKVEGKNKVKIRNLAEREQKLKYSSHVEGTWTFFEGKYPQEVEEFMLTHWGNNEDEILDVGVGMGKSLQKIAQTRINNSKKPNVFGSNLTPIISDPNSPVNEIVGSLDIISNASYNLVVNKQFAIAPKEYPVIITSHGPFHHSPIPGYALLSLIKLLKKDGYLIIVSGNILEETGSKFLMDEFNMERQEAKSFRIQDYGNVKKVLVESGVVRTSGKTLGQTKVFIIQKLADFE
jgi:SAM-dependent methyltransferase